MKFKEKKYILPALFLAVSVFLFVPINKAKAIATYGCMKNETCENIVMVEDNIIEFRKECANYCGMIIHTGTTDRCKPTLEPCPEPKEYGCLKKGVCTNVSAVDDWAANYKCTTSCGSPVPGEIYIPCVSLSIPCPPPTPAASGGPLAGTDAPALLNSTRSLNKLRITEPAQLIGRFIQILMSFIGSIALALYVWSGFLWMTASGNPDKITKAKTTMVWTTLGVLMMLASYMLASFLFSAVTK
jgi:hypothetical protein